MTPSSPPSLLHGLADVGDVELHYVSCGDGPAVVLLHGWPQTWYAWRRVIPLLAERFTVVAPDLRGLGDSSRPNLGYDKRTIAGDIKLLMHDVLGFDSWDVVGHDWGGVVAFALAAWHRPFVRRLAVLDVTIPGDGQPDISQGGRRWHHGFHRTPGLPEQLVAGREEIYLEWFYANYGSTPRAIGPDDTAEYLRTYRDPHALRAGFELYRALPQDISDNERFREHRLEIPVLAVGGTDGWGRAAEVAYSLRSLADQVQELVLPACGHWIPEEQPAALATHLLQFLA